MATAKTAKRKVAKKKSAVKKPYAPPEGDPQTGKAKAGQFILRERLTSKGKMALVRASQVDGKGKVTHYETLSKRSIEREVDHGKDRIWVIAEAKIKDIEAKLKKEAIALFWGKREAVLEEFGVDVS